jgi:hypothetical protein
LSSIPNKPNDRPHPAMHSIEAVSGTFRAPPSGNDHWYIAALLCLRAGLMAKLAYSRSLHALQISTSDDWPRSFTSTTHPINLTAVTSPAESPGPASLFISRRDHAGSLRIPGVRRHRPMSPPRPTASKGPFLENSCSKKEIPPLNLAVFPCEPNML